MYAQIFSNRSFVNCIVAYTDIREIYIFIIREQLELGFICIDANSIWFQPSVKTFYFTKQQVDKRKNYLNDKKI